MNAMKHVDVACVIHGDYYDFSYVEKLRNMVRRNLPKTHDFHVLTEAQRSVPADMVKHDLIPWPDVHGRRAAWWYKLQLFRPDLNLGQVLYFDLDTIIVNDLSWILDLDPKFFWSIQDFKYLWRADYRTMNSSLMYFDSNRYAKIWNRFQDQNLADLRKIYRGDQDYLSQIIRPEDLRFVDNIKVQSWRWQIHDGGIDVRARRSRSPGLGSVIPAATSVIVCHGSPKPHEICDNIVDLYWH